MKYILSIMMLLSYSFHVDAHDASYYLSHPEVLQQAITSCPQKQPRELSCEQLKPIAAEVNDLAYQLRTDPQGYGQKILALQELLAKEEGEDSKGVQSSDTKQELLIRLSIVKWLESPQG